MAGDDIAAAIPARLPLVSAWLQAPAINRLVAALADGGSDVRFVGGAVRDALIGWPVRDIDVATPLPPDIVTLRLERAGLRVLPTGLKHGTVTAICGARNIEVTTLRRDVTTDGRWALVAFTDDWLVDAGRRDLTFNALSARPDGTVFDYFEGRKDLYQGVVRFVGDPDERIREDVLRLLRFFRFHAWYGRSHPLADQLAATARQAVLLSSLSGERVRAEVLRLLAAPSADQVWALMHETGVVARLLPEAVRTDCLARMVSADVALGLAPDPLLRLGSLLVDGEAGLAAVSTRLRLSRAENCRLAGFWPEPTDPVGGLSPGSVRLEMAARGSPATMDWLRFVFARTNHEGVSTVDHAHLAAALTLAGQRLPEFPVSGADVLAFGLEPGPQVGLLLRQLRKWWAAGAFAATRGEALAELRRRI